MGGSNPKNVLGAICLHASSSFACRRRPCERERSFFCPLRKRQWRKPLPGSQRTWDSPAGLGPGGASCTGAARMSSAVHLGQTLPDGKGSRRSDNRREKESGWAVGWVASKVGLANLSRRQVRPQEILGGPLGRHPDGRSQSEVRGLLLG